MQLGNGVEGKPFRYDRLKAYFIYSFCLANGEEPLREDELKQYILNKRDWTDRLPDDRLGAISPFLSVKAMRAFKQVPPRPAQIGSHTFDLSAQFRLFTIGGTLTICFDLCGKELRSLAVSDTHDLLQVLGMSYKSQCDSSSEPLLYGDEAYPSLYILFKKLLDAECAGLKVLGREGLDLRDLSSGIVEKIPVPQSPWMVTVFKVSGPEQEAFCSGTTIERAMTGAEKSLAILPYYHDIGPVLFRSVSGENFPVEPTYRGQEGGINAGGATQLSNMHLDARMFVCSSRRNVVCVTGDLEGEPSSYFLPGILSINEQVRSRWHALVAINCMLDGILDQYGRTKDVGDSDTASDNKIIESRRTNEGKYIKGILRSRRWTARVLDDPGVYIMAGDALAGLYARGKEVFRLDELKTLLLQKADIVDRLHADEQQLTWIDRA